MAEPAQALTIEAAKPATMPARLLELAVEKGTDVDQLSKLMDLQERWEANEARKAFFAAKARFQSICPTIEKDCTVKYGNTEYKHASLPGIAAQLREPLQQCDLSYDWKFKNTEGGGIQVTCILSHVDGHSEANALTAPPDDSGSKNIIQQYGSTATYLQRYTLIGALGLTSADTDDDGKATGGTNVEAIRLHTEAVRTFWQNVTDYKVAVATKDYDAAVEAWYEMPDDAQRYIYGLAPTKGGLLSTEERAFMKDDEWGAARRNRSA